MKLSLSLSLIIIFTLYFLFKDNFSFVTVDGPAHLYNARILEQLIQKDDFISNYYHHLHEITPNFFSTYLLFFLNQIFTPVISEKVLIFLLLTHFFIGMALILKSISSKPHLFLLLSTPLGLNYLLGFGFYNFLFGINFLLISIWFYLNYLKEFKFYYLIGIFLCTGLTYLCHGLVFLIAICILTAILGFKIIQDVYNEKQFRKRYLLEYIKLGIIFLPGIYFILDFMELREELNKSYLSNYEIIDFISEMRPLILYTHLDRMYAKEYFYIFYGLIAISTYRWFEQYRPSTKKDYFFNSIWLIIFATLLLSLFFLPDGSSGGSFIIVRIHFLAIVFSIFWISVYGFNKWFLYGCLLLLFFPLKNSVQEKWKIQKELNLRVNEFLEAEKKIEENSTIFTMRHSNEWTDGHFSNYLGINKPVLILDNYEAGTGYFPVRFKINPINCVSVPFLFKQEVNQYPIKLCHSDSSKVLNYILFYGEAPLTNVQQEFLDSTKIYYENIYSTERLNLYKLIDKSK